MHPYRYRPPARHDGGRGPEDSPFWVSLSDMMTGMTSLFLVVACSVLLMWVIEAQSPGAPARGDEKAMGADTGAPARHDERVVDAAANNARDASRLAAHASDISGALKKISALSRQYGFSVDAATNTIDLGQSALFPLGSDRLSAKQEALLRSYVADLIALIQKDPAMAPLKGITVVGYTDPAGSYLFNLDLSARRSERLMCVLLASPDRQGGEAGGATMTSDASQLVRQLFKVGGYSASAQKEAGRAGDPDRRASAFSGTSARAAPGGRMPTSAIGQQARGTNGARANHPFASGATRRGLPSRLPSGCPPGVLFDPIAGRMPVTLLAPRHADTIRAVVNRPAGPVVALWSPAAARRGIPDVAGEALATDRANGKDEKDDIHQREQRDTEGLGARIKADVRQHIDAELRRRLSYRT